ncbi:MAG: trigger factor [Halobacteriovoraceae bacterium]|nr:trigger factor [Halobacteriovoraceae bacterium]
MNYTVQNVNDCTKKIVFEFESVDLSEQIQEALSKKQKTAQLKGFRPGKAPLSVIQKYYGPQVENEALYGFVSKEFYNAIEKEGLQPLGYPEFSNTKYEADKKNVAFEATIEVFPEISIKDYSSYEFTREKDEVKDEDLEKIKKQIQEAKSQVKVIEDKEKKLEKGLFAVLNFEGEKSGGEKPDNMKGSEYLLEIGSQQFIPGFEEGMVGMKTGEKKTIEVTFPEDYHAEDLKGAPVKFHVELLEIKEKVLPELTDELVKEYNFESVADFEKKTLSRLKTEKKRKADENLHQAILEKLVEENSFDIPNALVLQQMKAIQEDTARSLKQSGFNDDMMKEYFSKWQDDVRKKAEFQVRSGLILNKISETLKAESSESDLEARYKDMADMSGMSVEEVKKIYGENENLKKNLLYAIKEEKTFDHMKEKMKIN